MIVTTYTYKHCGIQLNNRKTYYSANHMVLYFSSETVMAHVIPEVCEVPYKL